jgi:hypothetical protein
MKKTKGAGKPVVVNKAKMESSVGRLFGIKSKRKVKGG